MAPARAEGPRIGYKRVERQHRLRNALDCAECGGAACIAQGALGEHHAAGEKLWCCMSCALFPATVQRCEGLHVARRLISLSWGMHPTVKCALSATACHSGASCFALMSWSPTTCLGLEWFTLCQRQAIVQLVVMVTMSCKRQKRWWRGTLCRMHELFQTRVLRWQESDVAILADTSGRPRVLGEGAFGQARAQP